MAKLRIPIAINSIDFSEAFNRTGYAIQYEERTGPNGFTSIAGTIDPDVLRYAPVLLLPINALWLIDLQQLRAAVMGSVFVPVTYLDLDAGVQTDYFHGTFGQISVPLITQTGYMARDGALLTMRGR